MEAPSSLSSLRAARAQQGASEIVPEYEHQLQDAKQWAFDQFFDMKDAMFSSIDSEEFERAAAQDLTSAVREMILPHAQKALNELDDQIRSMPDTSQIRTEGVLWFVKSFAVRPAMKEAVFASSSPDARSWDGPAPETPAGFRNYARSAVESLISRAVGAFNAREEMTRSEGRLEIVTVDPSSPQGQKMSIEHALGVAKPLNPQLKKRQDARRELGKMFNEPGSSWTEEKYAKEASLRKTMAETQPAVERAAEFDRLMNSLLEAGRPQSRLRSSGASRP